MANFTPNYNLEKPVDTEKYYISKFNDNTDKIDTALKNQQTAITQNQAQEQTDVATLQTNIDNLKTYTDNLVLTHNESNTAHSDIRTSVTNAITHLEEYADTAEENANEYTDSQITAHNASENAHPLIWQAINGFGATTQEMIDLSISQHNSDEESHEDIRLNAETYTNRAVSTHDSDPDAHGGKQVLYTTLVPSDGIYPSSMSYIDIQTAFSDGKGVNAIILNGGEFPLSIINNSVVGTRTSMEGNELLYETYLMNPNNNTFTRIVNRYTLNPAPPRVDEAVADYSIVVDPESESNNAIIGSAVIGSSVIGNGSGGSDSGGGDNPLRVEFSDVDFENDNNIICNVTAEEIITALSNNRRIISSINYGDTYYENLILDWYNTELNELSFYIIYPSTTDIQCTTIIMHSDGITAYTITIPSTS